MTRRMHLNLFIQSRGHHEASWRHPAASPLPLTDIRYYQDVAQRAEAGRFDSIFLADQLAPRRRRRAGWPQLAGADHRARGARDLDPPHRADRHGSTTYTEPFNLARQFASIDHISGGRAAGTSSRRGSRRRRATTAARARSATPTATRAARSSCRSSRRCGTAGPTMR
jgi:alkanesulfonate monooxygenase SsuD/methylene tetrahydromethanopterin reductase-like flavin-dependent oxidoreductase (luciferase family)